MPPACAASVHFSDEELAWLAAVPEPMNVLEPDLFCCLEAEHSGSHWTLGQTSGRDCEWWLLWGSGPRGLVRVTQYCEAETPGPPEDGPILCRLPDDHLGRHSFEYDDAVTGRDPSPAVLERIFQLVAEHEGRNE